MQTNNVSKNRCMVYELGPLTRRHPPPRMETGSQGPQGLLEQTPTNYGNRASSMMSHESVAVGSAPVGPSAATAGEYDALLLELAQAKTAEAIAKQEAEEAKQKLETLRKAFGLALGESNSVNQATVAATAASGASAAASAAMGMIGRLTGSTAAPTILEGPARATTAPAPASVPAGNSAGAGGFWGWRR
jgi:hypothetical protein